MVGGFAQLCDVWAELKHSGRGRLHLSSDPRIQLPAQFHERGVEVVSADGSDDTGSLHDRTKSVTSAHLGRGYEARRTTVTATSAPTPNRQRLLTATGDFLRQAAVARRARQTLWTLARAMLDPTRTRNTWTRQMSAVCAVCGVQ